MEAQGEKKRSQPEKDARDNKQPRLGGTDRDEQDEYEGRQKREKKRREDGDDDEEAKKKKICPPSDVSVSMRWKTLQSLDA